MVYFIFLLPALGFVDAAPTPWSNACGAFVLADERILYETLHGAERNRVLCELRGNLTKQVNSLRSYMGPKTFRKFILKHNKSYAFLNVTRGKNITLRTWHKQLQVYVAAADHLYERAYNYKNLHESTFVSSPEQSNKADKDLKRLRHLIITIRGILCEFELTANLLSNRQMSSKVLAIEATKMQKYIVQLRSYKRPAQEGVDPIDINMIYHRLRRALLNMRKALKRRCGKGRKAGKLQKRPMEEEQREIDKKNKQSRKYKHCENTLTNSRRKSHNKQRHQRKHKSSQLTKP